MPAYYMIGQPVIKGEIQKRFTISGMHGASQSTINALLEQGVIRERRTPPLDVYPPLESYVEMLSERGIVTLGDFAVAHIVDLAEIPNARALQEEVLTMINPANVKDDCCG